MNAIKNELELQPPNPKQGSIWINEDDGEIYILCLIKSNAFAAISLREGNRWSDPKSPAEAVDGLKLLAEQAIITVKKL